jgi:hypothetical protein
MRSKETEDDIRRVEAQIADVKSRIKYGDNAASKTLEKWYAELENLQARRNWLLEN